jgi:hypothetical protein
VSKNPFQKVHQPGASATGLPVVDAPGWSWKAAVKFRAALLVAACCLLPAARCPAQGPSRVPPFRTILVPPERVPALLEQAGRGVLVQLPRAELDKRLKAAAKATPANPPCLVKASYWADLSLAADKRGSLASAVPALVGHGTWTLLNPVPSAGALPLPELRLPLQNVKLGGADALLGDLLGKGPALWVEKAGQQTATFDWSLRGRTAAGEVHFDFQVPPCAAASLELTLPADYVVSAPQPTVLLEGPDFGGDPQRRLWRLKFGGRPQVSFVLRRTSGSDLVPPLVLTAAQVRQQVLPDRQLAEYRITAEALHRPLQELLFDLDQGLRPTEVSCSGLPLRGWQVVPPQKGKPGPATLIVRLREPLRGQPTFRIVAEAPLPAGRWVSPVLRLRGAVLRLETLELRVHPAVELEDWNQGGFHLAKASRDEEGFLVLNLIGDGAASAVRPTAHLAETEPLLAVRQTAWWHIGPEGASLTAEFTFDVLRGRVFQLALRLPADGKQAWQVEKVELTEPSGLLRGWVTTEEGHPTLLVDLQHSLAARQRARLMVRLRSSASKSLVLPFPEISPLGRGPFSGALAVSVAPLYRLAAAQPAPTAARPGPGGPWGKQPVQLYYEYRDRPLAGQLHLAPHRPVLHARCRNDVLLAAGKASLKAQLTLEPVIGAPTSVVVYLSVANGGLRPAAGELGVRRLERLRVREVLPSLLALGAPANRLALLALTSQPSGSYWRLVLVRPLAQAETIALEMTLAGPPPLDGKQQWDVPLLSVPQADRLDGEGIVQLVGAELLGVQAEGVREGGGRTNFETRKQAAGGAGQDVWRVYRYGAPFPGQLPVLRLRTRPLPVAAAAHETCEDSQLTTRVQPDGRLVHHFLFHVRGWRARTLPVRLPPGTELIGVRVEGCWMGRLPQRLTEGGLEIVLPVAAGASVQAFEIIYTSSGRAAGWLPWARLEAAVPQLPVRPLAFRRTWQLPPGLAPLEPAMQPLPGSAAPAGQDPWQESLRQGWQAGQGLLTAVGFPLAPQDWAAAQRRRLEDAVAALRTAGGGAEKLGPFLQRLVREQLHDGPRLVLDAAALASAGIGPDTLCPALIIGDTDAALLASLPSPAGILLTSRAEAQRLLAATGQGWLEEGVLAQAVAQAVRHGQDASGRFLDVASWISKNSSPPSGGRQLPESVAGGLPPPLGGIDVGWTEWEPLAGAETASELLVVRRSAISALGLVLAALFCLAAWRVRSALRGRGRVRLLLLWLALAGLSACWLPPVLRPAAAWPALAGLVVAGVCYLRGSGPATASNGSRTAGSGEQVVIGKGAVLLLVVGCLLPAARWALAGGTGPDTIYVLSGPTKAPDRQTVLVPQELLRKIDDLARPPFLAPTGAVLLSAHYEGRVHDALVDFKADFLAYCAADRVVLKVPLGGVDLKEGALLEGAPVYPLALTAPETGYAVPVAGRKGKIVRLTLPFSVRLAGSGDSRDLTFTIPRLVQSQLDLVLPAGALRPQVVSALGEQRVEANGQLHADLGLADLGQPLGASAVRVHWSFAGRARPAPTVRVRPFYLWDLRPPTAGPAGSLPETPSLVAVLQGTVTSGAVSHLDINLPAGTEVRSIEVTSQQQEAGAASPRLKTWRLASAKDKRRLTLELSAPVRDNFQVTLGLLPRLPLGPGTFSLVLPRLVWPPLAKELSPPGLLAYRVDGLEAADQRHHLAAVNIPFAQFIQQWEALGLRTFTPADGERASGRAYSFNRQGPGAALELMLTAAPPKAMAAITWTVAQGHADLQASAHLTPGNSAADTLALVEWEVPPTVTLADISGLDVLYSSRAGSRLQVWLRQPKGETVVQLSGWARFPLNAKGGIEHFTLPCVRLLSPQAIRTEVALPPSGGVAAEPVALDNLQAAPEADGLTFSVLDARRPYRAVFQLRPASSEAKARLLTVVEAQDGWANFTTGVQLERPSGKRKPLILSLDRWPGMEVRLDAPGLAWQSRRGPKGLSWELYLPAAGPPHLSFKLLGKALLPASAAVPVPEVRLVGADVEERWLAILGGDLHLGPIQGLIPVRDPAGELSQWPAEAKLISREGLAWKVQAADWRLPLTLRRAAESPAVTVLLAEQQAVLADGQHWLYETTWTLAAEAGADLHIRLPAKGQFLAAIVDGGPAALRQTGPQALWLPLPVEAGAHVLRLRWQFEPGTEALARPRLLSPSLQEGNVYPMLWTVWVPSGYYLERPAAAKGRVPLSRARLNLERAAAQLRLAELLTGKPHGLAGLATAELTTVLQDFAWYARQAEIEANSDPAAQAEGGPAGQPLLQWLRALRRQAEALARKHGLSRLRPGPTPLQSRLSAHGLPVCWNTRAGEEPPVVHLSQTAAQQARQDMLASELLLGLLLAVWILSHLRRPAGWLRHLWPEQLLLLALLGWYVFGPSLVGVVLLVLALGARILLLARRLPALLRRPPPAVAPAGSGSATT